MTLEHRIKAQFPGLIVTLLSVLIGLAFSDLVGLARERMTLWPLDTGTLRTWGQIFAMAACSFSVWVIFAHMNVSRMRIPALADSVIVFLIPLTILFGNSLIGRTDIWPWFYFASFYLFISLVTWLWQVRTAMAEPELASFARLTRPVGPLSVLYVGIPFYAAAGWADDHGFFSPVTEMLMAMTPCPGALLTTWIFFREWHGALDLANSAGLAEN
jgi:hypothetical protein